MFSAQFGLLLRDWRKASGVKQESLATILGVSQSAVSHWENGHDIPHRRLVGRIVDMMAASSDDRLWQDHLVIRQQNAVQASFDLDGVKLLMASKGLTSSWPEFSKLIDMRLADLLVGESSKLVHDEDFVRSAQRGDVAMISGISDQHVMMDVDSTFRHRWIAVFRSYGARMVVDMTYEVCDPLSQTGVQNVTYFGDIGL